MTARIALCALAVLVPVTAHGAAIAIDVGHYLARPGATSARGVPEFEYNLTLARDMAHALQARGHDVTMTTIIS